MYLTIFIAAILLLINIKIFTTDFNDYGISRVLTMLLNLGFLSGVIVYKLIPYLNPSFKSNWYLTSFAIMLFPSMFFAYFGADIPILVKIIFGVFMLFLLKRGLRLEF